MLFPSAISAAWTNVGMPGFSTAAAYYGSLFVDSIGDPYVAFVESNKASVMKFDGSSWNYVGPSGFSPGTAMHTSLYVDSATPYVAFTDGSIGSGRASVMKYFGGSWNYVGAAGFSQGIALYTSLQIYGGTPYVAFSDVAANSKTSVMSFDGSAWNYVGSQGFSIGPANYVSLAADKSNGTLYVAYQDWNNSGVATIKKFNGASWVPVGSWASGGNSYYTSMGVENSIPYVGFSEVGASQKAVVSAFNGTAWSAIFPSPVSSSYAYYLSLFMYSGAPYLAYQDNIAGKATVKHYQSGAWLDLDNAGFSPGEARYTSLFIQNGTAYVAYQDFANSSFMSVMKTSSGVFTATISPTPSSTRTITQTWTVSPTVTPMPTANMGPMCYSLMWGANGNAIGEFNGPAGMETDSGGNIFVVDTGNNRVEKFNSNGVDLSEFGSYGSSDLQFDAPHDIAIDAGNEMYVTDTNNHRVEKFDVTGNYITEWGFNGSGDGQFSFPEGIAVSPDYYVYVADTGNNRVQKFDAFGIHQISWGSAGLSDGFFTSPRGIAVDKDGNILVADSGNNRVQKFDASGGFITKWGSAGTGDGQFNNPSGITTDQYGYIYVADTGNNRVQKFSPSGTFIAKWGTTGALSMQFDTPYGITMLNATTLFASETGNDRVQKFIDCIPPTPTITPTSIAGADWILATGNSQAGVRMGTLMLPFLGKIFMVGGNDGGSGLNSVFSSLDGITWSLETSTAFPTSRAYHTGVVFNNGTGDKMWAIAGVTGSYDDDVWYSSNGITWIQATAAAGFALRAQTSAVVFDNKMWVIGGRDNGSGYLNDVWWSANGADWTMATGNAQFGPRGYHSTLAYNGKMYVIGGYNGTSDLASVYSSPDGVVWTQETASAAFGARSQLAAVTYDDGTGMKMWVIAGTGYKNDVWYSVNGSTWVQKTAAANFSGRMGSASCVFNGSMWLASGFDGTYTKDVWYSGSVAQPTATPYNTGTTTPTVTPFFTQTSTRTATQTATKTATQTVTPTATQTACAMPSSFISFPVDGGSYKPSDILVISGTAIAPCGFLTAERISIKRVSDSKWWDGSSFSMAGEWWNFGAAADPNWTYSGLPPWQPGESYIINWKAQDNNAQIENPNAGITINISLPPELAINQGMSAANCANCGDNITYHLNYSLREKPSALTDPIYTAPATKLVGAGQTYTSIAAAAAAAVPGDVIEVVDSGTYAEKIILPDTTDTAGIIIRAKPGTHPSIVAPDSMIPNGQQDIIELHYNCTIAGFTLDGRFRADHGICSDGTSGYRVDRCVVKNCRAAGISLAQVGTITTAAYPSSYVTNCVLTGNILNNWGFGIMFDQGTARPGMTVNIYNNVMYGNGGPLFVNSAAFEYDIRNCVMWANPGYGFLGDKAKVSYSVLQEATAGFGAGCVNSDPKFAGAASGNFHLQNGSPAINTGDNSISSVVTRDMDLALRPSGGTYDMGAYEYEALNCGATVTGASIWDTIPAGLNFVSASAGYALNGGVISWSIPSLCENDFSGEKYFVVMPASACPILSPEYFSNRASINHSGDLTPVAANPEFISLCTSTPTPIPPSCAQSDNFNTAVGSFWSVSDVGGAAAGSQFVSGGSLTITAGGTNNFNVSHDTFRFIYQPINGDFDISMKVNYAPINSADSSAGIMVRNSLSVDSYFSFVGVQNNGLIMSYARGEAYQEGYGTLAHVNGVPAWVRIVRVGNNFQYFQSTDGTTWDNFDSDTWTASPGGVLIGIAVTSASGSLGEANVDDFTVLSGDICTPAYTPTNTNTHIPTATVTQTTTMTITQTITRTNTQTATQTATQTTTPTTTYTATATRTSTQSVTQTVTKTVTQTVTQTITTTSTKTNTPSTTQTATQTATASATKTNTPAAPAVAVSLAAFNPGNTTHIPGDAYVTVMQLSIRNESAESVSFNSLQTQASGTGNDGPAGILSVEMIVDVNNNGAANGAPDLFMAMGTYAADNTALAISGWPSEVLAPGQTKYYVIAYSFTGTAPYGTYTLSLPSAAHLSGTGMTTGLAWNDLGSFPMNASIITLVAPTPTSTPTSTATSTFTATPTATDTGTKTATPTPSDTATATPTFTVTKTATETATPTFSATDTGTKTNTPTFTYTTTVTDTATPAATFTFTHTRTMTYTKTATPPPTATFTITQTRTVSPTSTPVSTPNIGMALDRNYVDVSKGETLTIKINCSAPGVNVRLKAYNITGELIRKGEFTAAAAGWMNVPWDLKNESGKTIGQGMYFIRIEAEGKSVIRRVFVIK